MGNTTLLSPKVVDMMKNLNVIHRTVPSKPFIGDEKMAEVSNFVLFLVFVGVIWFGFLAFPLYLLFFFFL
jgi:membrane-anchored protein YejM (alkaline phosphatase superfamily)